jgi:hypothetical protein
MQGQPTTAGDVWGLGDGNSLTATVRPLDKSALVSGQWGRRILLATHFSAFGFPPADHHDIFNGTIISIEANHQISKSL